MADDTRDLHVTRRDALKIGAAAAVGATAACQHAPSKPPGAFFSADEMALVDELSELIIPTDAHSPGARAVTVAAYVDSRLAEAWDPQDRTTWREGLAAIDRLSNEIAGSTFMRAKPDQRVAVLTRLAQNEAKPQTAEDRFFIELKGRVVQAYYSSEIGIKEMEYKGNIFLQEFSGTDVSGA